MLILTFRRHSDSTKSGDHILIGNSIKIFLKKTRHQGVAIGIECPREIPIVRSWARRRKETPIVLQSKKDRGSDTNSNRGNNH